jgi:phosphatidylglycerol:prolipoprotein diacylglycerol transferase
MILSVAYPEIDPIIFEIGPLAVRWYALAYIVGLLLGWRYMRYLAARDPAGPDGQVVDDFLVWATVGVVLGGRLGYILFYQPGVYRANPEQILFLWRGGMSFHGGALGVIAATYFFARRRRLPILRLGDLVVCAVTIGLFFGRIANFVNGELYGRPSDVPWAMAFPTGGPATRHPSQLYEAALEGLVLFLVLFALVRFTRAREHPGFLIGVFFAGYGLARIAVEFFREPDTHLGFLVAGATMGQCLSLPMVAGGLALVVWARRRGM